MYCFRCGKPIREDADYCTYCGTYLKEDPEPDAGKFPEKDIPVSLPERENPPVRVKRKAHSIWLAVVLGVFVCLAAAAVVLAGTMQNWWGKTPPFRNAEWGMTQEQVENTETAQLSKEKHRDGEYSLYAVVDDFEGLEGDLIEIQYIFTKDGILYGASVSLEQMQYDEADPYGRTQPLAVLYEIMKNTYGSPCELKWIDGQASVFLTKDTVIQWLAAEERMLFYERKYFEKAWPSVYQAMLESNDGESIQIKEEPFKRYFQGCVAVDTGHSPAMPVDSFTSELEKNNFEIKEFNLLTDEIPENTQVIILPSPMVDLTEDEVEKVNSYLNDEETSDYRNLVVLYTPQMAEMPNLKILMNEWGLDVAPQTEVVATSDGSYVQYPDYIIANLTDEVDLQGKSSYGYLLAPMSCPVDVLWNGRNEITTSVLMKSPSDAERLTYNEETEKMETVASGEENLIAMGTKMYKYDSNAYRNSNVVAVGCGLFIDSSFLTPSAFSNKDYAIELFTYLAHIQP